MAKKCGKGIVYVNENCFGNGENGLVGVDGNRPLIA